MKEEFYLKKYESSNLEIFLSQSLSFYEKENILRDITHISSDSLMNYLSTILDETEKDALTPPNSNLSAVYIYDKKRYAALVINKKLKEFRNNNKLSHSCLSTYDMELYIEVQKKGLVSPQLLNNLLLETIFVQLLGMNNIVEWINIEHRIVAQNFKEAHENDNIKLYEFDTTTYEKMSNDDELKILIKNIYMEFFFERDLLIENEEINEESNNIKKEFRVILEKCFFQTKEYTEIANNVNNRL